MPKIDFLQREAHARSLSNLPRKGTHASFKDGYMLTRDELLEHIRLAEHGDADAALRVSKFYRWTMRDREEASAWEEISALLGSAIGQYNLSSRYLMSEDYSLALEWAEKALASGLDEARELIEEAQAGLQRGKSSSTPE